MRLSSFYRFAALFALILNPIVLSLGRVIAWTLERALEPALRTVGHIPQTFATLRLVPLSRISSLIRSGISFLTSGRPGSGGIPVLAPPAPLFMVRSV